MTAEQINPYGDTRQYLLRQQIDESLDLAINFLAAARLANARAADQTVAIHLQQGRLALIEAITSYKELAPQQIEGGRND